MAPRVAGILEPANSKNPVARAEHIEMPDGKRLSEFNPVSSWNDLTDKPFGAVDAFEPIVYDVSKLELYDSVELFGDIFYRVSDATPTDDKITGATVRVGGVSAKLERYYVAGIPSGVTWYCAEGPEDPDSEAGDPIFSVDVLVDHQGISGNAGTYVRVTPKHAFHVPAIVFREIIETIDPKYLPDDAPEIKEAESGAVLEPGVFYEFGEVGELAVTLAEKHDGRAHEYILKFTPLAGFDKPVIVPEPVWFGKPQFPAGEVCVVSVLNGLAVSGHGSII